MNENIVLIGFMACGKGRTARALHRKTGWFAVDSDDLIESVAKMKIRKLFERYGEEYFRALERKTARWLQHNVRHSIISTGGGFVHVPQIREIGKVVFLNRDFDEIIESIRRHPDAKKKIKKRPLLQDLAKARQLYDTRIPLYRAAAHLEIDRSGKTVDNVCDQIITAFSLPTVETV